MYFVFDVRSHFGTNCWFSFVLLKLINSLVTIATMTSRPKLQFVGLKLRPRRNPLPKPRVVPVVADLIVVADLRCAYILAKSASKVAKAAAAKKADAAADAKSAYKNCKAAAEVAKTAAAKKADAAADAKSAYKYGKAAAEVAKTAASRTIEYELFATDDD